MHIENDADRREAIALCDRLRAARMRVYVMTVQEAADLELDCRRIGLLGFRYDGSGLCVALEDYYDDCAHRIERAIAWHDEAKMDAEAVA